MRKKHKRTNLLPLGEKQAASSSSSVSLLATPSLFTREKYNRRKFATRGAPGAALAGALERLRSALALPRELVGTRAARDAGLDTSDRLLLPGFFELLLELQRRRRKFLLVFRTFGQDLLQVARELNAFCEGRHPLYPNARFDGSAASADYDCRLSDSDFGTLHLPLDLSTASATTTTATTTRGEPTVVIGTVGGPGNRCLRCKPSAAWYAAVANAAASHDDDAAWSECAECAQARTTALKLSANFSCTPPRAPPRQTPPLKCLGLGEVLARARQRVGGAAGARALALRDDYVHWAWRKSRAATGDDPGLGGKPLALDPADATLHPIFFDDNFGWNREAHILDLRSHNGHALPFDTTNGLFAVKAEPLLSITDKRYFIDQVDACERARACPQVAPKGTHSE